MTRICVRIGAGSPWVCPDGDASGSGSAPNPAASADGHNESASTPAGFSANGGLPTGDSLQPGAVGQGHSSFQSSGDHGTSTEFGLDGSGSCHGFGNPGTIMQGVFMRMRIADNARRATIHAEAVSAFETARPTLNTQAYVEAQLAASLLRSEPPAGASNSRDAYFRMQAQKLKTQRRQAEAEALWARVEPMCNDAQGLQSACQQASEFLGEDYAERREVLDLASALAVASATQAESGDAEAAKAVLESAKSALDIAIDFTPGFSLAKDVVSLATRKNPITGESVGDVEAGLILAGIFLPGAMKATGKIALKSVKQLSHGLSAAATVATKTNTREVVKSLGVASQKSEAFLQRLIPFIGEGEKLVEGDVRLLARAVDAGRDLATETAAKLRKSPGKATWSNLARAADPQRLLRGRNGHFGTIPKSIGDKLAGREFKNFDEFREQFWKLVSESPYSAQFSAQNRAAIAKGNSPYVLLGEDVGKRAVYELHHIVPIGKGGGVYDISNILIATPRLHVRFIHGAGDVLESSGEIIELMGKVL